MAVLLRPYESADFVRLYALDHRCFPPGIAYSKRMLRYFLRAPQSECFVAVKDEQIAAFIITEAKGSLGRILTLDVEESQRRFGLGSLLLTRSEESMAGRRVREVMLETSVENAAGIAFWQRHGFRTVGVLRGYYLGRVDAYEMRKEIIVAQTI